MTLDLGKELATLTFSLTLVCNITPGWSCSVSTSVRYLWYIVTAPLNRPLLDPIPNGLNYTQYLPAVGFPQTRVLVPLTLRYPRQAPSSVFSVEILGSWDNFCKAYQLKRDRRTGPGHWRGCHTFENITCDGDTLDVSPSREGGLKMGGTYWYYVSSPSAPTPTLANAWAVPT